MMKLRGMNLLFAMGLAAVALALAAPAISTAAEKASPAGPVQAKAADDFLDSVGVCMHLGRTATVYVQKFPEIEKLLLESGIRHVRTDPVDAPVAVANAKKLGEQGVRFDIIIHASNKEQVESMLDHVKQTLLPYTEIIEGPNEPDGRAANARARMQEIYDICKSDPAFKDIPVLGCALANPANSAKNFGDCTAFVDIGNIHAYPGGRAPEVSRPEYVKFVQPQYPGKQYMITETGYHSALNNPPKRHRPTAQAVEGIYMPRLYLDYFKNGILRSYKYQFADDRTDEEATSHGQPVQEAHFGLVDLDMQPKPSYTSIKNLMAILADKKVDGFQPGTLDYRVSGPDDLRSLLLQKSNGDFYLAVWRAVPIWDEVKRVELPVETKAAKVALKQPASQVRLYRPTKSAEAYTTLSDVSSIPLKLDGEVVILEIPGK